MKNYSKALQVFRYFGFGLSGLLLLYNPIFAQSTENPEIDLDLLIQELFPDASAEIDYEDLFEALSQLYASPLDMNKVTRNELASTYLLTEQQLDAFFEFRHQTGPFISIYELQAIPGFDLTTIRKVRPIFTLTNTAQPLRASLKNPTHHYLMLRSRKYLQTEKGYTPVEPGSRSVTRYAGSPLQAFGRYRYSRANMYSVGITSEKDSGEEMRWMPERQIYGMDFTSFHVQLMNRGRLKNLIIGDFLLQSGQGMVFSSGFSIGKGAEAIKSAYRFSTGLRPYTSSGEAGFFRGIATTFTLSRQMELTTFYSRNRQDATISGNSTDDGDFRTASVSSGGLHRTPAEQLKHRILRESNIGLHWQYRQPAERFQIGVSLLHTHFEIPLRKADRPYNQYEFTGTSQLLAGIHADYRWKNIRLFSETARSASKGWGNVTGSLIAINKLWDVALLFRRYDRHFHTFYGNSFAENTRPINESGQYLGIKYHPGKRWQANAYYDHFRFPWMKYQVDAPSKGYGYLLHTQWTPHKKLKIYAVVRSETKEKNNPVKESTAQPLITTKRRSAIVNFEYNFPLKCKIRTRLQAGDFIYGNVSRSTGLAIAQDASWKFRKLELSGRMALFNTDDYDSRQYIYEKDVLYAFSLPAYYDTGTRHFLMMRYDMHKKVKLWIRWAQTRYKNLETISSGLSEIQGNKRSEIKAQLMLHF